MLHKSINDETCLKYKVRDCRQISIVLITEFEQNQIRINQLQLLMGIEVK